VEEGLVVLLLGVDEDDVEDVSDRANRLGRIALDQVDPLLETRLGDIRPPRLDLAGVVLE
jgi:hypothetical protein